MHQIFSTMSGLPIRSVAMVLYYAEHAYKTSNGNDTFTSDLETLNTYASPPILATAQCSEVPVIELRNDGKGFVAYVADRAGKYSAVIRDDRQLTVIRNN